MAETPVQLNNALPSPTTQQAPAETAPKQPETAAETDPTAKFRGAGTSFRAKMIGIDEVPDSRGDKMCQDSILKLKGNVKVSGQHKQKIVINISMDGLKLIDLMTAQVLHEHRVDRISFIARDLTDRRAFGYIVGDDDEKHRFFAIKTAKVAEQVVLVLRDLFQVAYNIKQKEMESAKAQSKTLDSAQDAPQSPSANAQATKQQGNILNLEQQLENMQQMSDMDAFKTTWPANAPTTPDTSQTGTDSDMFGMANLSDISSLSSDFSLTSSSNDPTKLKDAKHKQQNESLQFRRSSSQKSAASWSGTTSDASSVTQKRHASLTVSRAKELKETLPEITGQSVKDNEKLSPTSSDSQHNNNKKVRKDAILEKESPGHVSIASTKSGAFGDDSFFNEVMAATGFSPPAIRKSDSSAVDKSSDVTEHANKSGSTSSISSSGSRRSSHKSLSLTNIFFGKSEKKKSFKRDKNLSRQSSASSVKSAKQLSTPTDTISDTKSTSSRDHVPAVTSSRSSLRSYRKSSSSSNISVDRISREHSSSCTSSQTDVTQPKSKSVRIRPSAAVARARPRAALPPTATTSTNNPPMFKTTSRMTSEDPGADSNKPPLDSRTSVNKFDSSKEDTLNTETLTSCEKVSPDKQSVDSPFWACFGNETITKDSKTETFVSDTAWGASVAAADNHKKDAWNAFGGVGEKKNTDSPVQVDDLPFSGDPFNDNFNSASTDQTSSKEAENAFDDKCNDAAKDVQFSNDLAFPVDPFSSDADSALDPTGFESCDPFGETGLSSICEDPFQNYEAVFGMTPNAESNLKIDTNFESKQSKEVEVSNSSETLKVFSTPQEKVDNDKTFSKSDKPKNKIPFDEEKSLSTPVIPSRKSSTVSSFHSSASSKRSSTASSVNESTNSPIHNEQTPDTLANFDTEESSKISSSLVPAPSTSDQKTSWANFDEDESSKPSIELSVNTPSHNQITSNPWSNADSAMPTKSIASPVNTSSKEDQIPQSSWASFDTEESSKKNTGINAPIDSAQLPRGAWANFDADETITFDEPSFENGVVLEPSFSPPLPSELSPPPPLPPRRPKRVSTSSEEAVALPPAMPPPPLPSRPRHSSRVVNQSPASSESDSEPTSAPPNFQPPQLPANLQSELCTNNLDFSANESSAHEDSSFQPSDSHPNADDSVFDFPCKKSDTLPPMIPKRQTSKQLKLHSLDQNSNNVQGGGSEAGMTRNEPYSDDLAGFSMEALQPAAGGGAKLTKDQILAGFGQAPGTGGMYQQVTANPFSPQQPAASPLQGAQFAAPMPQQYAVPFGSAPQAQFPMSGFPVGPRPAVPARSGAMKLPVSFSPPPNQTSGVFGDAPPPSGGILAPTNLQPDLNNGSNEKEKKAYDPFGSLVPGMGSTDKKDMFKNFKLAKPPSKSDLADQKDNASQDTLGISSAPAASEAQNIADPFASLHFGEPQSQQPSNNVQSLFG